MTKIVLLKDVQGLGSVGSIVEVKDGYSRNHLIPKGMAVKWTRGAERHFANIASARKARELALFQAAQSAAEALPKEVTVFVNTGKGGHLFGAVTPASIAKALVDAGGHGVDKSQVITESPIKTLGEHSVQIKLHEEVQATVKVVVCTK